MILLRGLIRPLQLTATPRVYFRHGDPVSFQLRASSSRSGKAILSRASETAHRTVVPGTERGSLDHQGQETSSSINTHSVVRNRKATPAKAKAQASASRALREQIKARAAGAALPPEEIGMDEEVVETKLESEHPVPSISQPVRRLRDVFGYATADSYNFEALIASGRLPSNWQLLQDGDAIYIPHWPPSRSKSMPEHESVSSPPLRTSHNGGEAFIFRSGSYVTWGMSGEQSRKLLRSLIRVRETSESAPVEINGYDEIGDEGMEFIMVDDQVTRIVGDIIVIGRPPQSEEEEFEGHFTDAPAQNSGSQTEPDWTPLLARLAFSQGLGRSARLSVQEAALSSYLEEVSTIPGLLEAEGKVPLPRRQVIRKMGTLLQLRQRANLDSENFLDDPEMYWDNAQLEANYDSVCAALDIESRFKAYNEKLDHGENLLGVLRALLTEASTHRMELIIIYLIAFEVCLALISHEYVPSLTDVRDAFTQWVHPESIISAEQTQSGPVSGVDNDNHLTSPSFLHRISSWLPGFTSREVSPPTKIV